MSHLEPFKYTQLPPGHIRLLQVLPLHSLSGSLACRLRGKRRHVLECELRCKLRYKLKVFSLEKRPPFEALSYAWGTQAASEHIVCNGARLSLTPHLLDGLRNISKALSIQWLWIDAICIHQFDEIEKASQVMQMWQIYSAASRVVVWMGPSDITDEALSAVLDVMKNVDEDDTLDDWSREDIEQFLSSLKAWYDEMAKLFISPWFERLWVLQEVVLAQKGVALYGMQTINLASVLQLGRMIQTTGINLKSLPNRDPLFACAAFSFLEYYARRELKAQRVVELMNTIRIRQTSEPLDRVYGILGLLEEHVGEQIVIDYSQTSKDEPWKAYIQFCRLILQEYGESYLIYLSGADRSALTPSWCVNLDVRASTSDLYNALRGAGVDESDQGCSGVVFSGGGPALHLRAYQVDAIENVHAHPLDKFSTLDIAEQWGQHLSFVSSCYDLALELVESGEKKPLGSLAKVLVGGIYIDGSTYSEYLSQEVEGDLRNCLEIWKDPRLEQSRKLDLLVSVSLGGGNSRYLWSSSAACNGRSISLTRSGRWVLAPGDAQVGDIIVVIKGFEVPYALRPAPVEKGQDAGTYRILGACYVEDIMDGEVLRSEAFRTAGWSDITII